MTKKELYKQILKGSRNIHRAKDLIKYFQGLLKQAKYSDKKGILAYINGTVCRLQKEYVKAEKNFKISIEIDNDLVYPYNELGNVYYCLKEYDNAIEYYKKAIKIDDKFAHPYNGLGKVYDDLKDYDNAIVYFNEVIKRDDKDSNSYFGLGNVYYHQKDYDKAIEYYKKAIKINDKEGSYYYNFAQAYKFKQNLLNAKKNYEKAISLFKMEEKNYWISVAEKQLIHIENNIVSQNILKAKDIDPDTDKIVKTVLNEIRDSKIDTKVKENEEKSLEFLEEKKKSLKSLEVKEKNKATYFEVLRRWNSYTPIVADNYYASKGGGYFIKESEDGIVIDPGFNFIDNFRGAKHKFNEVTTVLISHAHNDHTSDLESILTLLHTYNRKIKKKLKNIIAERDSTPIDDLKDSDIESEFMESEMRKIINFYITKSVFIKYSGLFNLCSKNDYLIHIVEKGDDFKITNNIECCVIEAKHNDIISDRDSVGFLLSLYNTALIYTGDTGWSDNIEKQYDQLKEKCKDKYVLLIAHIGGFKKNESNYLNPNPEVRQESLYKHHLGRIGLARINEILKPDVCLISEFGEEFKGHRKDIAKIYQKAFNDEIIFIPADIGLKFCLKKKQFEVATKINTTNSIFELGYVNPVEVELCLLEKDYSLHYYKKNAGFTETRFIQKVRDLFDKRIQ
jgi:tetratricopeptide (TPR) repeat protein